MDDRDASAAAQAANEARLEAERTARDEAAGAREEAASAREDAESSLETARGHAQAAANYRADAAAATDPEERSYVDQAVAEEANQAVEAAAEAEGYAQRAESAAETTAFLARTTPLPEVVAEAGTARLHARAAREAAAAARQAAREAEGAPALEAPLLQEAVVGFAPEAGGSARDWSTIEIELSLGILAFGLFVMLLQAVLMWRRDMGWTPEAILRFQGVTLIITGGLVLVVAGYSNNQMAPLMGLLGTIAGYLLGSKGQAED